MCSGADITNDVERGMLSERMVETQHAKLVTRSRNPCTLWCVMVLPRWLFFWLSITMSASFSTANGSQGSREQLFLIKRTSCSQRCTGWVL